MSKFCLSFLCCYDQFLVIPPSIYSCKFWDTVLQVDGFLELYLLCIHHHVFLLAWCSVEINCLKLLGKMVEVRTRKGQGVTVASVGLIL